uniref:8.9 kDa family member n=1 Tax=Amblyomma parvum TaxID=251391 RepID=A0A023FVR9_AMBPA
MKLCALALISAPLFMIVASATTNTNEPSVVIQDNYCIYRTRYLYNGNVAYLETPCEKVECRANISQIIITACPPPNDAVPPPKTSVAYWPRCCPRTT